MPHTARRNRRANERRRQLAAERQRPLPLAEQQRRAALRAAEHAARYPVAPTYRDIPDRSQKVRLAKLAAYMPDILSAIAFRLMRAAAKPR